MRVTISMACFQRPKRTIRAIESIVNQNINGWEALVVGDGCPFMADYITSNYFSDLVRHANSKGNSLEISNLSENKGGYGYHIINTNIDRAKGKYFTFMANDDIILENHLQNYLSGIENTDYDFVFYNSFIEPLSATRIAQLEFGAIGHSEIIVTTDLIRKMPKHSNEYGHDWSLIENLVKNSFKMKKVESQPTYIVKGIGNHRTDIID
jgi:GT2 family glycosyltransferase